MTPPTAGFALVETDLMTLVVVLESSKVSGTAPEQWRWTAPLCTENVWSFQIGSAPTLQAMGPRAVRVNCNES